MWHYATKILVTAMVVVAVAEISKRSTFWAALLASLPLTSLLAFVWLYLDTGDARAVAALAQSILWLVIASLPLFLVVPLGIRAGVPFWPSLGLGCLVTVLAYLALTLVLRRLGVAL